MFRGNYNFFDYKYNIIGYTGQDYGGSAQYVYLIVSIILMTILLISLRKLSKEKVNKIIKIVSIFLIIIYIVKTTWESIYDIKLSGSFNTGLLSRSSLQDVVTDNMAAAIISEYIIFFI